MYEPTPEPVLVNVIVRLFAGGIVTMPVSEPLVEPVYVTVMLRYVPVLLRKTQNEPTSPLEEFGSVIVLNPLFVML